MSEKRPPEDVVSRPLKRQSTAKFSASLIDQATCPISLCIMTDPVIAKDGHSYERCAIVEYFSGKKFAPSPLTKEHIQTDVVPNLSLRRMIENLVEQRGDEWTENLSKGQCADWWLRQGRRVAGSDGTRAGNAFKKVRELTAAAAAAATGGGSGATGGAEGAAAGGLAAAAAAAASADAVGLFAEATVELASLTLLAPPKEGAPPDDASAAEHAAQRAAAEALLAEAEALGAGAKQAVSALRAKQAAAAVAVAAAPGSSGGGSSGGGPSGPPLSAEEEHFFLDRAKDFDFDGVRALVEQNARYVNVQPCGRWSALHQAAHAGDRCMVKYLLGKGADRTARNGAGQTPLDVARSSTVRGLLGGAEGEGGDSTDDDDGDEDEEDDEDDDADEDEDNDDEEEDDDGDDDDDDGNDDD